MNKTELIDFEREVARAFTAGRIRAPVHLSDGNEEQLIRIFSSINRQDWVLCSWRSHYHCLLKGVPRREVFNSIVAGRSISLCFPEYRILSSAIAGGHLPIAVGIAMGIQRTQGQEAVWCFLGDMAAEMGIAHECMKYSAAHRLPLNFVVEDNGLSVCTPTLPTWGTRRVWQVFNCQHYEYKPKYPHAGAGVRVQF